MMNNNNLILRLMMTIKMAMRISPMMYHVYPCVLIHRIHKHGADCYQPTSSSTVGSSRYCIPYLKMTFFLHGQIIISRLKNHHQFETLVSFVLGVDKRITPHTYDEKKKKLPHKRFWRIISLLMMLKRSQQLMLYRHMMKFMWIASLYCSHRSRSLFLWVLG